MKDECSELSDPTSETSSRQQQSHSSSDASRRNFMKTLAAAGATAILPSGSLFGQAAQKNLVQTGRVDVHHHIAIPAWTKVAGIGARWHWTPEVSLAQMDKFGIGTAIMSVTQPGVWYGNVEQGRQLARECNEYMAKMVQDYPGRFGTFLAVPLPDQDGTLREIEYGYGTLKADGVGLLTSYEDKWLGDPSFVPAFEEMNRRNAVAFVHVTGPSCCKNLVPGARATMSEYDFDTTRTAISMLVNGTFSRFPKIRFIFCHSGGTLPVMSGRIRDRFPVDRLKNVPDGVIPELQRQYYEVAHGAYPTQLGALTRFVAVSQMLFGTDYPAESINTTISPLDQFGFSAGELHAINRGNAEQLFPRLRA